MLERMWNKGNTSLLLVGMQTCTTTLEISMVVSQKIRKQPTSISSDTTLGYIPKKDAQSYHKDTCSTIFIAALFVIASIWKQPRCSSNEEEWIKKM